jgi:hypothetical protein
MSHDSFLHVLYDQQKSRVNSNDATIWHCFLVHCIDVKMQFVANFAPRRTQLQPAKFS